MVLLQVSQPPKTETRRARAGSSPTHVLPFSQMNH